MINRVSTTTIVIDCDEPYCNRGRLDTGTSCNYNCSFCYYKDRLNVTTDLETIKKRVDYLVECGIQEVDLSGGESSIHPDWFEILDYCQSKGIAVSTLSNGSMFCDIEFLTESVNHGLKEILFSLHGYDRESHDEMVGVDGAFDKIIQAINNANDLGVVVRINCVVTHRNYKHLRHEYVDLIHSIFCYEVNFLTLNPWQDAQFKFLDYVDVACEIQGAIDRLLVKWVNVRYIPYCYMVGYEKHVCNVYQHIHDRFDWNMAIHNGHLDPTEYRGDELRCLYREAAQDRIRHYYKTDECIKCRYFFICDGVDKSFNVDVYPQDGEKIKDINYFRKNFYED